MKTAVDIAIEAMDAARAEHDRVFSKGIARADLDATRKANDAIGAAIKLAWAALGIPMQYIGNDRLLGKLHERSAQLAQEQREQDVLKAGTIWQDLAPSDIRRTVAYVARQSPDGYSWPTYERFIEILTLPDAATWKDHYFYCGYVHHMYMGKWAGWWELSWDMFDSDEIDLYPIQLVTVSLSKTAHTHFPSLLAELKLFKSAGDAKKNGWAKPLALGDFLFKKKTYILRLVE
jgi:hypothetical protein